MLLYVGELCNLLFSCITQTADEFRQAPNPLLMHHPDSRRTQEHLNTRFFSPTLNPKPYLHPKTRCFSPTLNPKKLRPPPRSLNPKPSNPKKLGGTKARFSIWMAIFCSRAAVHTHLPTWLNRFCNPRCTTRRALFKERPLLSSLLSWCSLRLTVFDDIFRQQIFPCGDYSLIGECAHLTRQVFHRVYIQPHRAEAHFSPHMWGRFQPRILV
jgi:hypothetical protein